MKDIPISPIIYWNGKNTVDLSVEFRESRLMINKLFVAICDYETAFVLYEHSETLYLVEVCECYEYGLDGEWNPIKTTIDEIRKMLESKTIVNKHITKLIRRKLSSIKRYMQ